jgi:hypothetical protein
MAQPGQRKCLCCDLFFHPDPRNDKRQGNKTAERSSQQDDQEDEFQTAGIRLDEFQNGVDTASFNTGGVALGKQIRRRRRHALRLALPEIQVPPKRW